MNALCRLLVALIVVHVASMTGIPVTAFARDNVILLPATTVYPDQPLSPSQFRVVERPAHLPDSLPLLTSQDEIAGKVPTRVLPAGHPVLLAYLKRATVVRPGMTVNVFFQSGGITITLVAQALGEGGIGDMIMARNLESGRSIRGLVQHDGSLRVMP